MRSINLSSDILIDRLLNISISEQVCILDSSGAGHLNSHLLVAGIKPIQTIEITGNAEQALAEFEKVIDDHELASFFTLSYEFGATLSNITNNRADISAEPLLYCSSFDCIIVHDYSTKETFLTGSGEKYDHIADLLFDAVNEFPLNSSSPVIRSNFTRDEYILAVEEIRELIRSGITYQANLTQQFTASFSDAPSPQHIFKNLRQSHPAPFAAFIQRPDSTVVSASPERFFRIENRQISVSPIKGTRKRGADRADDMVLRTELLNSHKDRAENVMIVDLLRNDLGRICEYGSINVKELCSIEEHPTLFHLVSTINGKLRSDIKIGQVLRSLFPCGSITGAPKISTMQIIDRIEPDHRGLSMGAIGVNIPPGFEGLLPVIDVNVAIRTMVFRENKAVFNVGGGIVIDSDPQLEYEESLLKAKAILASLGSE